MKQNTIAKIMQKGVAIMAKWVTTDCRGNEQIWYSADVIEKIKEICNEGLYAGINYDILEIIESEDK